MPHRNNIICSDKKMCFSKFNMLPVYLRRAKNNKNCITIHFNLWPLMGIMCIFNGKIMQAEFKLNLLQNLFRWLMQADPNKLVIIFEHFVNITEFNICYPAAMRICSTIDDFFHFVLFE